MSKKSHLAVIAATAAASLAPAGAALATPARDAPITEGDSASVISTPPVADVVRVDQGGVSTLEVVLLASGALVAGGVAGFGGAKVRASHSSLRAS